VKNKELVIKLKADIADYKAKLEIATGKVKDLEDGIEKVERTGNKGFKSLVGGVANFTIAAKGIISSFQAIAGKTAEFINLSNVQEKAEKRLEIALKNSGDATRATLQAQKDFASEIQATTTVGDEQAMMLQSMALTMGATSDNVGDVTKNAIALSKAFDIDMNTALRASVSAVDDNYEMLTRYIPKLRTAGTEAEKTAIYQQSVNDGWKVATGELESGYGAMEDFDNTIGDLKEDLGDLLKIAILPFIGTLKDIVSGISSFKDSLVPIQTETEKVSRRTQESTLHFETLKRTYLELAKKTNRTAVENDVLNNSYKELQKTYPKHFKNLKNEKKNYDEIKKALQNVQTEIENKAKAQIKEALLKDKQAEINALHKEGMKLLTQKMRQEVIYNKTNAEQLERQKELREQALAGVTPTYDNTWHELDRDLTRYNLALGETKDKIAENKKEQAKVRTELQAAVDAYDIYWQTLATGQDKLNSKFSKLTNGISGVKSALSAIDQEYKESKLEGEEEGEELEREKLNVWYEEQLSLYKDNKDAKAELDAIYDKKSDDNNKKSDDNNKKWEKIKELRTKQNTIRGSKAFLGSIEAMGKSIDGMGKVAKRAAQGQALIDTYASANAVFKNTAEIPVVGPFLAPIAAAAAIAAGIANVAKIENTKMAKGGIFEGPSHANGGINIGGGIEVEGGEVLLAKGASKDKHILTIASAINEMSGGKPLAPNLNLPFMETGGIMSNPVSNYSYSNDNSELLQAIKGMDNSIKVMNMNLVEKDMSVSVNVPDRNVLDDQAELNNYKADGLDLEEL